MTAKPIIDVIGLSHTYTDEGTGIRDITFSVFPGDFILVAGRNGSGKSTLFRHLNGLLLPDCGEVLVNGISVSKNPIAARKTIGMVFQDPDTQIVGETVSGDIAFGPENLGLPRVEINTRVESLLHAMGLTGLGARNPATLSGGQKRRLAIAGVLAMEPRVLVLDEPFSNLDYPGCLDLLACILRLHGQGHTILLATHDIERVLAHATRMIILDQGTIARDGDPSDLVHQVEDYGVRKPCYVRLGLECQPWER